MAKGSSWWEGQGVGRSDQMMKAQVIAPTVVMKGKEVRRAQPR